MDRLKKYYRSYYKQFTKSRRSRRHHRRRRQQRSVSETAPCRSCGLLLVADHSFYQNVGERSVKQTVLQMLYHIREANLLLRHQDYDRDGYPDCVGVHVTGVGVLASSRSDHNLLTGNFSTSEEYLRTFSKYQFDNHCLAVLFSSKIFAGKVLGLSWKGGTKKAGGICQNRVNVGSHDEPEMYNLNSLFVTLRTKNTKRIPLRMGVLNLVHELLHSFGASHDPRHCTPTNIRTEGRYLMSKYSSSGVKKNNEVISNCTAASVASTLSNEGMSHCLVPGPDQGFCGDGVVGVGEDCDCGSVEECLDRKSHCVPPGMWRGETQCTVRRLIKYQDHPDTKIHDENMCNVLGLDTCQCPYYHENSVTSCDQEQYCQRKHQNCQSIHHWASQIFQEIQDYIYRVCWSERLLKCVEKASKWSSLITNIDKLRVSSGGQVYCLRTTRDSQCWRLDWSGSKDYWRKNKKHFTWA